MAISDENVNISFNLVPEKQVEAAIANDYTRIDWTGRSTKNIATVTGQIKESIAQGIREGQDYSQMANNISDRMGKSASDMQRIARTEGHRCREQGNLDSLNFAHKKGLNLEKEWVAALDERTRDAHATLDGQTVGINEEFVSSTGGRGQGPGLMGTAADDANCRCSLVGVTPGEKFEYRGYRYDDAPGSFIGKYSNYMDWAEKKGIKPHLFTDIAKPQVAEMLVDLAKMSKTDADAYLKALVDDQSKKLTAEEVKAINGYTGADSRGINDHLRGLQTYKLTPGNKKAIQLIDDAFAKATPLGDDLIVHRNGTMRNIMTRNEFYDDALREKRFSELIGSTIKDDGFISTTTHGDLVEKIAGDRVKYDIILPRGSNAQIPVGEISFTPYENEILLNRGSVFTVEKAEMLYENKGVKFDEKRYIHMVLKLIK
jgi:SPP1 gp7 family putative phage head morphogenesis protein